MGLLRQRSWVDHTYDVSVKGSAFKLQDRGFRGHVIAPRSCQAADYDSHMMINPTQAVPLGLALDLLAPYRRGKVTISGAK